MLLEVYIYQILELMIKLWLKKKQNFMLKEDSNSGYNKAKNYNIIRQQKKKKNLEYYFNCISSPNLSSINNY